MTAAAPRRDHGSPLSHSGGPSETPTGSPQHWQVYAIISEKPGKTFTPPQCGHCSVQNRSVSSISASVRSTSPIGSVRTSVSHSGHTMSASPSRGMTSKQPQQSGAPNSEWGIVVNRVCSMRVMIACRSAIAVVVITCPHSAQTIWPSSPCATPRRSPLQWGAPHPACVMCVRISKVRVSV